MVLEIGEPTFLLNRIVVGDVNVTKVLLSAAIEVGVE